MKSCNFLYLLSSLMVFAYTAELPSSFKKCKLKDVNFKDCLKDATINAVKDLKNGNKDFHLLSLDPLGIDKISIPSGEGSVVINQEYSNIKMHGLTDSSILEVKQMDYGDFGMEMAMDTLTKSLQLTGDYTLSGRMLLLPIQGNGKFNITLENLKTVHHKSGEWLKKDGETYISIKKYNVQFIPGKVFFHFGNLFNGDKALGDNMNKVMNDNSQLVFNELKGGFEETFKIVFKDLANKIFEHVPFNKIFIE